MRKLSWGWWNPTPHSGHQTPGAQLTPWHWSGRNGLAADWPGATLSANRRRHGVRFPSLGRIPRATGKSGKHEHSCSPKTDAMRRVDLRYRNTPCIDSVRFLPSEIGPRVVYPPGCCRTRCNHDYLNILKRALSHTRNATKERKPLMRGERERKRVHCTHMCPHTFISKSPQTDGTPACLPVCTHSVLPTAAAVAL